MSQGRYYRPRPAEGEEIPVSVLRIEHRDVTLWTAPQPIAQEKFPPCIRNIISRASGEIGRHRAAAILAAFLGQAGWSEEDAKALWKRVAEQSGVSESIFSEWFGKMHCPRCSTLRTGSRGYPHLGLADLGYCQPDERCRNFGGPVAYASDVSTDQDPDMVRRCLRLVKSVNIAHIFDWKAGKEGDIELAGEERLELEALLMQLEGHEDKTLVYTRAKVSGKLRPKFFLKDGEGLRRRMLSDIL